MCDVCNEINSYACPRCGRHEPKETLERCYYCGGTGEVCSDTGKGEDTIECPLCDGEGYRVFYE